MQYRISSNEGWALNTSRKAGLEYRPGTDVIVLIEAGPWIQAGGRGLHTDRVWQLCTLPAHH